ncbi:MAG: glycosyltransferase [Anaerolineae bacterium]|nr:glycosyltransferase [Anaerolineae bacterium]
MRILFVTPYIPSLVRVRPYNLLHALVQRGHEVTLLALQPPGESDESLPQLRAWCRAVHIVPLSRTQTLWNGLAALPGTMPIQAAYSRSPEFARVAHDLLQRETFDVAHVEHLRGAVLAEALGDLPVVFDSVDSIALLFEKVLRDAPGLKSRLIAALDLARTRRFEGQLTDRFQAVAVTSEADRQALIASGSAADHILVVRNGVDLDYFQPLAVARDPQTLVFTGKMSYHANVAAAQDLVEKIMPLVWAEQPATHLQIVGKDPAPVIRVLGEHPNITVTGFVPDMRPYLAGAAVAVSTVRYGVGIQNKVLEAMAMATPVVCSPQACSALSVRDGDDVLIGDTPEHVARHILDLLASSEQRDRLGSAGRHYVEQQHSWDRAATLLEGLYAQPAPIQSLK